MGSNGGERVALAAVGLGRWGRVMASAYRHSSVVELRTCYTRDPERRARFAADYSCAAEESYEALLARDDVDGVVLTVPNDQHAPMIEAAAAAGKNVYVEKPVAVAPADVRRIAEAVRSSGIVFACGHSARRLAGVREMRRRLEAGELGQPSLVEAVFSNERGLELKDGDWRGDPTQCPGGPLTQLGIHQIDNLNYLFGVPRRVMGTGRTGAVAVQNAMVVAALLEFDEVAGYLGADWLTPGAFTIDLYGSTARLRYDLDFSWWSNSPDTDAHTSLTEVAIAGDSSDPDARVLAERVVALAPRDHLREEIEEFALATRGEAAVEVNLDVAIANVAVVLSVARAIDERRQVEVAEVLAELGA